MTRGPESHTGFHLSRAVVDSSHRKAVLRAVAVLELTTMTSVGGRPALPPVARPLEPGCCPLTALCGVAQVAGGRSGQG